MIQLQPVHDNYPSDNCSTENCESLTLIEDKTSAVVLSKMTWISKVVENHEGKRYALRLNDL